MISYCDYAPGDPVHGPYHDLEYGFPRRDDSELFERLMLEINQAGLNWGLILKRRAGMREAYAGFDPHRVARFDERDRERLLADPRIIRNRLKVDAAIHNAGVVVALIAEHGSFANWLDHHHPLSLDPWRKLFRSQFRFTGGEIVREFLVSLGYLPGAHKPGCPSYAMALAATPPWSRSDTPPV